MSSLTICTANQILFG